MIQLAYGAPFQIALTVVNDVGSPVSVTGWTARAEIERFDDRSTWAPVLSLGNGSVANGGAAGTLSLLVTAPQTTSLDTYFGSPTPTRNARVSFYATPSGGAEVLILQQPVTMFPAGAAVVPFYDLVTSDSYTFAIGALNHDRVLTQWTFGPAASGDITGAADAATLLPAVDDALSRGAPLFLWPNSTYYLSVPLVLSDDSSGKQGRGFQLVGAASFSTVIVEVFPNRTAGTYAIVARDQFYLSSIKHLKIEVNRAHAAIDSRLQSAQPLGCEFQFLRVYQHDFTPATSTTSMSATLGSGKVVTYGTLSNHWDGIAAQFTVGTNIWLGSRSSGAIMWGQITAWNPGAHTFTFTSAEVWDTDGTSTGPGLSGTHADWDIRFPCEGLDASGSANANTDHWLHGGLYCAIRGDASFNLKIGKDVINEFTAIGPAQYRAGVASQGTEICANYEPTWGGWAGYIYVTNCFDCLIRPGVGDGQFKGSAIYLKGSECITILGGSLGKGGGADSCCWVRAENVEGLKWNETKMYGNLVGAQALEVVGFCKGLWLDLSDVPPLYLYRASPDLSSVAIGYVVRGDDGRIYSDRATISVLQSRYFFVDGFSAAPAENISPFAGSSYPAAFFNWGAYTANGANFGILPLGYDSNVPDYSWSFLPPTATAGFAPRGRDAAAAQGHSPLFIALPTGWRFYTAGVGKSKLVTNDASGNIDVGGAKLMSLALPTASKEAVVKQSGAATLVAGTVTVATADINAQSTVTLTRTAIGGTAGAHLVITAIANGTPGSFTVTAKDATGATVATDTSTFRWQVI